MIVRMLGADTLALVMGPDRRDLDCSWLLTGPTDDLVVEPPAEAEVPPLRWAAE